MENTQEQTIAKNKILSGKLKDKLKDRIWRLNHLYYFLDDDNNKLQFKLRPIQKLLLKHIWFLNVILKARQLGVTTFFCIFFLDECLFNGVECALIAHTEVAAKLIFEKKIKYAWDNLEDFIKEQYELKTDTKHELCFNLKSNNRESRIYVSTTLRSGTVQRLHISELSTIDQMFPIKAGEIKSGALNMVHSKQIVTIESTARVAAEYLGIYANCQ